MVKFRERGKYNVILCSYEGEELSHSSFIIQRSLTIQLAPAFYGCELGSYYKVITPSGQEVVVSRV